MKPFVYILTLFISAASFAQTTILNTSNQEPVSYATIAFGNGQGIFADDEGVFIFTKEMYSDVDTLLITALGFKDQKIPTANLPKTIYMEEELSKLEEVIVEAPSNKKYKTEKIKNETHDDYFKCWLPTIESEIAVYFPNENDKVKKLAVVNFPIKTEASDWKKRNRSRAEKRPFSTLFRVQFYENNNGFPGDALSYQEITFRVTEENEKVFDLDVNKYNIYMPDNGLFISIQVLGYTDDNGKLLPNKKYKEIKGRDGEIVRIPTNFRPLLPFTDKLSGTRTFVKRIFIDNNQWNRFEKKSIYKSSLLDNGVNNYGMGIEMKIFKNE